MVLEAPPAQPPYPDFRRRRVLRLRVLRRENFRNRGHYRRLRRGNYSVHRQRIAIYRPPRGHQFVYVFAPVFFANIGINTSFAGFTPELLLFGLLFVLVGILGKIIGCGLVAKACRFTNRESIQTGVGMIARGEVALVVCKKGIEGGLFAGTPISSPVVPVIMLVVISSLLAPILLKIAFKGDDGSLMTNSGGGGEKEDKVVDEREEAIDPADEQTVGSLEPVTE